MQQIRMSLSIPWSELPLLSGQCGLMVLWVRQESSNTSIVCLHRDTLDGVVGINEYCYLHDSTFVLSLLYHVQMLLSQLKEELVT